MSKLVKPLTQETLPQLVSLVVDILVQREAVVSPLKLNPAQYTSLFMEKYVDACFIDGFSCTVYDAKTGRLIGCGLAHLLSNDVMRGINYPPVKPIFDLLGKLQQPACIKNADPSVVMYMDFIVGLLPSEGGQKGITEMTLAYMLNAAKSRGIKYAKADLTSPITRHVFLNKFGFKAADEVVHAECGVPQYKGVPGKTVLAVLDMNDFDVRTWTKIPLEE